VGQVTMNMKVLNKAYKVFRLQPKYVSVFHKKSKYYQRNMPIVWNNHLNRVERISINN